MYPDCAYNRFMGISILLHTTSVCKILGTCDCFFLLFREIITVILWVMASVACGFLMQDTSYKARVVFWLVLMGSSVVWEFAFLLVLFIGSVSCIVILLVESYVWMSVGYREMLENNDYV